MRLSGGQLAGGNSTSEKAENDFYATDPKTVDLLQDRQLGRMDNLETIKERNGQLLCFWLGLCGIKLIQVSL